MSKKVKSRIASIALPAPRTPRGTGHPNFVSLKPSEEKAEAPVVEFFPALCVSVVCLNGVQLRAKRYNSIGAPKPAERLARQWAVGQLEYFSRRLNISAECTLSGSLSRPYVQKVMA